MTIEMVLRSPSLCIPVQFTSFSALKGEDGVGVPKGGRVGQVLKKASDADFDTEWQDDVAGGGGTVVTIEGVAQPTFHADTYVECKVVDAVEPIEQQVGKMNADLQDKASKGEVAESLETAKKHTDEKVAGKLDKIKNNTYQNAVYYLKPDNTTALWGLGSNPNPWGLVTFTGEGTLKTNTATEGNDTVPLAQMNEALTKKAGVEIEGKLDSLEKKVDNLWVGQAPDMFFDDDATAYVKDIPADVAPYAELRSVGGMVHAHTIIAENLFSDSVLSQESGKEYTDEYGYGGLLYRETNGSYSVTPLSEYGYSQCYDTEHTFGEIFPNAEVGKRYIFTYDVSEPWDEYWSGGSIGTSAPIGTPFTMTEAIRNSKLSFYCASHYDGTMDRPQTETFSNISLKDEQGDVRYLTEAKVTALDFVGKNLYNGGFGGNACATEVDGVLTMTKTAEDRWTNWWYPPFPMTEASISAYIVESNITQWLGGAVVWDSGETSYITLAESGQVGNQASIIRARGNGESIQRVVLTLQNPEGAGNGVRLTDIAIFPTATPTDTTYSPYHKHTFPIPAEVQAIDGYGWGIPNGAHNGVEWDDEGRATFVKRVERVVFNGTEAWVISDTATEGKWRNYLQLPNVRRVAPSEVGPAICNYYDANSAGNNWYCKESVSASDGVLIYDEEYNTKDVSLWKAHLAELYQKGDPLTVYYELAEPIITDISHLITDDNLIPVEGGGVIVAQNENEEAAPTTIRYQVTGATLADAFDQIHEYAMQKIGGTT